MALPAIEPAVEPTAEPMTLDQNPPPLDVAELLGSSSKALSNFAPRELLSITQAKLLCKRLFRVLLKSFLNRLVDDGRIFLHNGRALRCIALRGSRTGERTTAAEPTTTSCFSCCRNEKGDRNGRHNSFLHR